QAQQIFNHLTKNLSAAELAAGPPSVPRDAIDTPFDPPSTPAPGDSPPAPPSTTSTGAMPSDFVAGTGTANAADGTDGANGTGVTIPAPSPRPERDINSLSGERSSSGTWRVSVDPPQRPLSRPEDARLGIKVPGTRSAGDAGVLYPLVPSPYVLLG